MKKASPHPETGQVSPLAIRMAAEHIGLPPGATGKDIAQHVWSELAAHPCREGPLSGNERDRIRAVALIHDHDLEDLMLTEECPTRKKFYEVTRFNNRSYFSRLNRAEKVLTATEVLGLTAPPEPEILVLFSKYLPKDANGVVTLKEGIPDEFAAKAREMESYGWDKAKAVELTGGKPRTVSSKGLFALIYIQLFDFEDLSPLDRTKRVEAALELIIPQLPKKEKAIAMELRQLSKKKTVAVADTTTPSPPRSTKKTATPKGHASKQVQLPGFDDPNTPSFMSPPFFKDGTIYFQFVGHGQATPARKKVAKALLFIPPAHRKTSLWTRAASAEEAPTIIKELVLRLAAAATETETPAAAA